MLLLRGAVFLQAQRQPKDLLHVCAVSIAMGLGVVEAGEVRLSGSDGQPGVALGVGGVAEPGRKLSLSVERGDVPEDVNWASHRIPSIQSASKRHPIISIQ